MFDNFKPNPKPIKSQKKARKPLPKYGKNWKKATKAELEHLEFVKSQPCFICQHPPISEAHHINSGSKRMGHYFTLPLCGNNEFTNYEGCHEGRILSIGKTKKQFIKKYGTELEMLHKFWESINFDKKLLTQGE